VKGCFSAQSFKSRGNLREPSASEAGAFLDTQTHRWGGLGTLDDLFSQTPEGLVEGHLRINAPEGTHGTESTISVPPSVGSSTANQVLLNAVEDGPEVGRRIFRPPGL